jgi:N-acetylglucosamine-6-sulfatase
VRRLSHAIAVGAWGNATVRLFLITMLAFLATGGGAIAEAQVAAERPNIVFILTDDLDKRLLTSHLSKYPNIQDLAAHGVTFKNAFVTNALCCPSRSTILSGLYSHNHHVMDNDPPNGGASAFRPLEPKALPVWLDNAGYATGYVGKYLNNYDGTYAPPGWDEWKGRVIGRPYLGKDQVEGFGMDGKNAEGKTHTQVFADEAVSFVRRRDGATPYFLFVSPYAPHDPGVHADRYDALFSDATLPRPPSFNERDVSDKPAWIRDNPRLTTEQIAEAQRLYRNRLRSMKDVDRMVGRIVGALRDTRELSSTYVVFFSDNGYHAGQHRLRMPPKRLAYEEDIKMPLIVRGPGAPTGVTRSGMVLNNDLAPTIARWAQANPLLPVDGRSLVPMLGPSPPSNWRTALLAEASPHEQIGRPAYRAVRTRDHLYVRYANGEKELYDLARDPYELRSFYPEANDALRDRLRGRLSSLARCAGAGCRSAEGQ